MQTLLVRLKPYDPRRGFVLRRYTYRGIKFHEERGWYRVDKEVGEYLRSVRQVPGDEHAPLAFDVHTEAEAKALEADEAKATTRKKATDPVEASTAVTTADLEESEAKSDSSGSKRRSTRSK
ncbi:MAG TPA: hypothetical protein RMH85_18860 [Polyangiaceae bacterium LLY-WYZ-15_(1-7)]|jgi:hypothetical protein|nr:hypothetical protein [Myxococcales bacterium]MAT23850.1 hypothetical protein [Sandaracinus sp.]HJK90608.1 hypothetical protein [Polyangiaceae bacterium LLY-WYZ-15_(1-7)]HJL06654.1 hypothetical protein [Polyangiaceae bacterium LLY-WYZ-15_(1-7)]HJL10569.1 hypothetical protein [Polyangiaceae bacterium LLY-WYZ-15_(1-7)]